MKKEVLGVAILATALAVGAMTACSDGGRETTADTTAAPITAKDATTAGAEAETTAVETEATKTVTAGEAKKIIVGTSSAPHAETLNAAKEVLASKGYELDIMEYIDYVLPDNAPGSGDLDTNYLQHRSYLDSSNEQSGIRLIGTGAIHYKPFRIYTGRTSSLDELKDKATVLVPNNIGNEVRASLPSETQGLIKLKEDVGLEATRNDTAGNPKNLDIVELEAAQLSCSLPDCDIMVINGNYTTEAGLKVSNTLMAKDSESLTAAAYGDIVAVREGDETTDVTKALIEALTSPEVKQFIEERHGGTVVPLF